MLKKIIELKFTPTAWAKLVYLRDLTKNEVGAFGISNKDDLLLIEDIKLVKQEVSTASVDFDDEGVADYFEDMVEAGLHPSQFARIWVHTHPGMSALPSFIDEETFERVFSSCDWSIMCIVSSDEEVYCRLRFSAGPGGTIKLPVVVDYSVPFNATDFAAWKEEYDEKTEVALVYVRTNLSWHQQQAIKDEERRKQKAISGNVLDGSEVIISEEDAYWDDYNKLTYEERVRKYGY